MSEDARSAEAIHRKLRAIAAVLADPATTEHERANAQALKLSLEKQLSEEPTSEGTWTDIMFRLGRAAKEIKQSSATSPKGDWTDYAFRARPNTAQRIEEVAAALADNQMKSQAEA